MFFVFALYSFMFICGRNSVKQNLDICSAGGVVQHHTQGSDLTKNMTSNFKQEKHLLAWVKF